MERYKPPQISDTEMMYLVEEACRVEEAAKPKPSKKDLRRQQGEKAKRARDQRRIDNLNHAANVFVRGKFRPDPRLMPKP